MTQYRPLGDSDAHALDRLTSRIADADGVTAFSEYKAVDLDRRGGHSLAALDSGSLIAVGHASWHHGDAAAGPHWAIELALDPMHRHQGLWSQMVRQTVALIPPGDAHVVWGWNVAFERIARDLGYRPARRLSTMERSLPTGMPVTMPVGVTLAGFEPGQDEDAWLAANNAAFFGHPENGGLTREDLADRMRLTWFRPEDLLMAWRNGELAGSCWTKRHDDAVGEIYVIGVHPEHQGIGLGRELVIAGLDHLDVNARARTAMLYVDHRVENAVRLYTALGFEQVRVTTMYELGS